MLSQPPGGIQSRPRNPRGSGARFWYDRRAGTGPPPGRETRRQGAREHRTPLTDFKENAGIAATFTEMGRLLELSADEPARVRAFLRVADILLTSAESVGVLAREGRLRALPGISAAAERIILEWLETGRVEQLERLRLRVPETVLDLLEVEVLTPAQVRTLSLECGIASADQLREACLAGRIADMDGFGVEIESHILQSLHSLDERQGRHRINLASAEAERMLGHLRASGTVMESSVAGRVRRCRELVEKVVLVASADTPHAAVSAFLATPGSGEATYRLHSSARIRMESGIPAVLHVTQPERFVPSLVHHTGSRGHHTMLRYHAERRGLRLTSSQLLRAGGEPVPCRDEEALYRAVGLPWIPPELRENTGEFDVRKTPRLVEPADLRGVVHCHTTWSDGRDTLADMARTARELGYHYLAVTDHSQSADYANGLNRARVLKQHAEIDRLNASLAPFRVLKGIEAEIRVNGTLDYDDDTLGLFDVVVVSIHTDTDMSRREATRRVIRALEQPRAMILAHPTGRVLLSRPGYLLDMDAVADAAAANNVAVEINANPSRLDLDWRHLRRARDRGVKFVIGPDAHQTAGLWNMPFGVGIARKGWLTPDDILNCKPAGDFLKCLRKG